MKKIRKKIIYIAVIAFLYIACRSLKVEASSVSLTANTTNPVEGQSVTVTATVNSGAWNLKLSGAGKSETIYGYTNSASNSSDSKSITFTAGSAGTVYKFSLTGDMTDISASNSEAVNKSLSITVKAKENNTTDNQGDNNNSSNNTNAANTTKSTEARLSNLGIKEKAYDFKGFKRDNTDYSVEVPNDVTSLTVYATPVDSKAKVAGTGKVNLKEGKNAVKVTVTAESGNTKTYNLTITRKASTDAKEETTNTTNETDNSNTTTSTSSTVFGLSSIEIKDVILNPDFDTEIYQYTVDLNKNVDSLDIATIATDDDTTVEVAGNENLQDGENIITIVVQGKKNKKTATYQITVNKNVETEDGEAEHAKEVNWLKPSTWGKEEIIKLILAVVLVILIIIAVILKIKLSKDKKKNDDIDLPGADELDKAIAEHQELTELKQLENNLEKQWEPDDDDENMNYIEDIANSDKYNYNEDNSENKTRRKGKGKHF